MFNVDGRAVDVEMFHYLVSFMWLAARSKSLLPWNGVVIFLRYLFHVRDVVLS